MTLPALAALYILVGTGAAVARLCYRALPRRRIGDAVLLMLAWPLFGPFLVMRVAGDPSEREVAFLVALGRARGTPLGAILPSSDTAKALAARLRVATGKVEEIERILMRPEFRESEALDRLHALRSRGASDTAISTATLRVQNIRRLRSLRDRFANELDEIGELLMQLSTQAEVVRLAGAADASSTDLVLELVARVEGLDAMLDDDPHPVLEA